MSWFTDIFNPKKQQAPNIQAPPTLSGTAEYPLYKQTLEDRIAGRNLGYDPAVLDASTAPYAKKARADFTNYTVPQIAGAASARGLGRSTIPVSQIGLGSQDVENSIANRVAQLTLANEEEKAAEKNSAISSYGGLMSSDYNSILNNIAGQNQQAIGATKVQNENNASALEQEVGALKSLQPLTPLLSLIPGVGPALAVGANVALGSIGNKSSAAMNIAGSGTEDLQALLKQLMGGATNMAGNSAGGTLMSFA
jgi:hypothetical protein